MPVFTAIAAGVTAIAGAVGFSAAAAGIAGSVAAFAARTLLTVGITKLIANRSGQNAAGTSNAGSRVQLPPATDNKLPVVYGSAFIGGVITDAKLSEDQKTMWYVVSLAEVTDTTSGSAYTFGNLYYDNKQVTFGTGGDAAKVLSLTTNTAGTPEVDTKIAGNLFIYLFPNGSYSGINTGGQSAVTILSDSSIPSDQRWNQGIYTANGQTADMTNTAFAIVKVVYNQDAGTTNLGALTVQLQNNLYQPGSVIKDYLTNPRYGCAIPLSKIDTASLTALNAYSAETITYEPVGGGTATQARYRIDGPINTGQNCLNNLQQIVDSCDSWLQYSEMTGQWKVVINQSYTDYTTLSALYEVDSSNLVGGIEVNPLDLNGTYNIVEVQYPNYNIKDQTDFQTISLFTSYPSLLSPNEPINKLNVQLPQVNNAVQAKYLALRRLFQGREDLAISFSTDYSGIQVEAGDVIKVTLSQYGWTDKLFRVSFVGEQKYADGSLGATMTAFEYNDSVYDDNLVQDFVPDSQLGLSDPNIIGTPSAPTVIDSPVNNGTNASQFITGIVPTPGQVLYMDFNYGTTSDVTNHVRYTTTTLGGGKPYTAGTPIQIEMANLPAGTYYWSVTARNKSVGVTSPATLAPAWGGPSVRPYSEVTKTPVTSSGTQLTVPDTSGILVGQTVTVTGGTGAVPAGTTVESIDSSIFITISDTPTTPIVTADVKFGGGGLPGDVYITPGSIDIEQMGPGFTQIAGTTTWAVTDGLFADLTTGTYNVPSYLDGTTVSSTEYFPFAQGTSSTAIGYVGNSTGPFEPLQARQFLAPNGTDNWWLVGSAIFSPPAAYLSRRINLKMVSDTNTTVQLMSGRIFPPPINLFSSFTTFTTINLEAGLPQTINLYDQNIAGTATDEVGFMVRNMVSGTTVYFYDGDVFGYKNS
jgi:hypothetical protein